MSAARKLRRQSPDYQQQRKIERETRKLTVEDNAARKIMFGVRKDLTRKLVAAFTAAARNELGLGDKRMTRLWEKAATHIAALQGGLADANEMLAQLKKEMPDWGKWFNAGITFN